jgi:hypothetical protein
MATDIELTNKSAAVTPALDALREDTPLERTAILSGPVSGPSLGQTLTPPPTGEGSVDDAVLGSPYTSMRVLIQNLTLPTVPNFDIPHSPPGSPPQKTTKKFAQFLELKKKGQHFNQRLESSSVLRDPGHLRKLLDFAGISEEEQYASSLSKDVAVPTVFPLWAYAEELRASQKRILKAKDLEKSRVPRESIDFVTATVSGTSSSTGMEPRLTVQAPLQTAGKRKELEHRGRDDSKSRSRRRSRSRSPKRERR